MNIVVTKAQQPTTVQDIQSALDGSTIDRLGDEHLVVYTGFGGYRFLTLSPGDAVPPCFLDHSRSTPSKTVEVPASDEHPDGKMFVPGVNTYLDSFFVGAVLVSDVPGLVDGTLFTAYGH
jgi:hypothetical protein